MSVEMACTCGGLPSHSHVFRHDVVVGLNGQRRAQPVDTGEIRIWVDWKAVAREARASDPEKRRMTPDTPVEIAAESQRRFAEDPKFQARATMIDGIVVESVQRIFGRTLSDEERDAARFAIAVALIVAEQP